MGKQSCVSQLPMLSVDEHLAYLLPLVEWVTSEYNALEREFEYEPTQLIVDEKLQQQLNKELIDLFSSQEAVISVPKRLIAWYYRDDYKYVASTRDTRIYWPCRKQNYDVAMRELNGQVIQPWWRLNINTLIANKPGYCTGWGTYRFYSGVCGWSTQLFWNAVLHPWLDVVERHSHSKRYAWFYGSNVMGDDASIYEWSKELIIENTSETPIWFGIFLRESDENTVLVSAWKSDADRTTLIQKEQHGPNKAMLHATIYNDEWLLGRDSRTSYYYGIDTSVDETAVTN
jgi:hypothetical protein